MTPRDPLPDHLTPSRRALLADIKARVRQEVGAEYTEDLDYIVEVTMDHAWRITEGDDPTRFHLELPRRLLRDLVYLCDQAAPLISGDAEDGPVDETDLAAGWLNTWQARIRDIDDHLAREYAGGDSPADRVLWLLSGQIVLTDALAPARLISPTPPAGSFK